MSEPSADDDDLALLSPEVETPHILEVLLLKLFKSLDFWKALISVLMSLRFATEQYLTFN